MSHSSDDPSNDRSGTETPRARPAERLESEPASPTPPNPPAADVPSESAPPGSAVDSGEPPRLPHRRRRRRRRPPRPTDPAQATTPLQDQAEPPAAAADAPPDGVVAAVPPNAPGPRRRRRRRRGPPRASGAAEPATVGPAEAAESSPVIASPSDGEPQQELPAAQPRGRRRRQRPPRPLATSAAEADRVTDGAPVRGSRTGAPQYRSGPYRGSQNRGARNRRNGDEPSPDRGPARDDRPSADRRARGKRPPGRDDRRPGRGRDAPRKRPEPRLYALEAIVDRGFEDVVDPAEDNLTRRVHWTIVKRTVADQESGKPVSATYVLKRDGVDTEFPGLGAARSAANKTIVHPEKLTMSKAEHAAEHAAAKK